jgi:hypothetical protein
VTLLRPLADVGPQSDASSAESVPDTTPSVHHWSFWFAPYAGDGSVSLSAVYDTAGTAISKAVRAPAAGMCIVFMRRIVAEGARLPQSGSEGGAGSEL